MSAHASQDLAWCPMSASVSWVSRPSDLRFVGPRAYGAYSCGLGRCIRSWRRFHALAMRHKNSGVDNSIGAAVTSVRPEDGVAVKPGFSCRRCMQCKEGRYNICPRMKFAPDPPLLGRQHVISSESLKTTFTNSRFILNVPVTTQYYGYRSNYNA